MLSRQLKAQVDIPWPREARCLESHGLNRARTILDIGCGNGYFLCRLAKRYPNKKFIGIDMSRPFITEAQHLIQKLKLKNVRVFSSACPAKKLTTKFDFIYSRLVIYCAPNKLEILKWAQKLLNKKGRFCIIDVDDGQLLEYPTSNALTDLFLAKAKLFAKDNIDRFVSRKLPHMLLSSGFKDVTMEAKYWYSSFEMPKRYFKPFWMHFVKLMQAIDKKSLPKRLFNRAFKEIDRVYASKTATTVFPIFIVSGRR